MSGVMPWQWNNVAPGILALDGTQIRVQYAPDGFIVSVPGRRASYAATLCAAKAVAEGDAKAMIELGLLDDPRDVPGGDA
jgi:hypothetical protein